MLRITTIGAFPCPEEYDVPNWFKDNQSTAHYTEYIKSKNPINIDNAISMVIDAQVENNVDILTDGEIYRENYIHYFCRYLTNIDFDMMLNKNHRNNAMNTALPVIVGPIKNTKPGFSASDWLRAQKHTEKPLKFTIPGPMTIVDTLVNNYYDDLHQLRLALINIIKQELRDLVNVGCKYIQLDEPCLARYPDLALSYGIADVEECFSEVSKNVNTIVHMCCGYPTKLDEDNYQKAEPDAYMQLADSLDKTQNIKQISIEDAFRNNDLALFHKFKQKTIILGSVNVCKSKLDNIDDVCNRVKEILTIIPKDRLILAPDCGLGFYKWSDAIMRLSFLNDVRFRLYSS